jgi:Ca2+-binding RTX toxin-like protein
MATFRVYAFPVNLATSPVFLALGVPYFVSASTTEIVLRASNGTTQRLLGQFVLDGVGQPVSGTIASLAEARAPGASVWSIEGLSLSLSAYAGYTQGNDQASLRHVLFAGADSIAGGTAADTLIGDDGNDTIDGGTGADVMKGGNGDDVYVVDRAANAALGVAGDVIVEVAGAGTETVRTSLAALSLAAYANVENLEYAGIKNFSGTGNALANRLTGGIGNDTLRGAAGDDVLVATAGNDVFDGGAHAGGDRLDLSALGWVVADKDAAEGFAVSRPDGATAVLTDAVTGQKLTVRGIETFTLTDGELDLAAMLRNVASPLADTLAGTAGADTLAGGAGNDLYLVDHAGDTVVELPGAGVDTVQTALAAWTLAANVEKLVYMGSAGFAGTGNAGANRIDGGGGNDTLDGGLGVDTLVGGVGDDSYVVDRAANPALGLPGDAIIEAAVGGSDTVQTALGSLSLAGYANVENLTYTGAGKFSGTGNALDNGLTGGSGNDTLNGGAGNDTLTGGAGNDRLLGGAGDGDLAVFSGTSDQYTFSRLGTGVLAVGPDGADTLVGIEWVRFGEGDAVSLAEMVALSLPLVSATLPEYVLPALLPAESNGWRWNDGQPLGSPVSVTYSFMVSLKAYQTQSDPNEGPHRSFSPLTAEQQNVVREALALYASYANISFTEVSDSGDGGLLRFGRDLQYDNSLGYSFYPTMDFPEGGDVWLANDQEAASNLELALGDYGRETIMHEIGHAIGLKHPGNYSYTDKANNLPTLRTAEENTRYSVMSYHHRVDGKVVDIAGDSSHYYTSIRDWTSETPMLYDIAAVQALYGANTAYHPGADTYTFPTERPFFMTLWDGGGSDTLDCSAFARDCRIDLRPGAFSSIGRYDNPRDQLPDWYAGVDTPTYAGENNLAIAYGSQIESALGGAGDDTLVGNDAANVLDGGAGLDTLSGGSGADIFDFSAAPGTNNIDTVLDFLAGTDTLRLDLDVFAALGPAGALAASAFQSGAGLTSAQEADDRIIYDTASGALYYDADGSGAVAAVRFAVIGIGSHALLTAVDFAIA